MIESTWLSMKRWRAVSFGPLSLVFSFRRRVRVTPARPQLRAVVDAVRPVHQAAAAQPQAEHPGLAVLVGVGPGLGHALARHLGAEGFDLALVCRNAAGLTDLVAELSARGNRVMAEGCDATSETQVAASFKRIHSALGVPALVVYGIQEFGPGSTLEVTVPAFESAWRHNCLGAFLVSQEAGRLMQHQGRGSIILVGSTSSMLGRAGHLNLAVGKFGQRALAQVLARELWPQGIHVAHVVVDADIREDEPADYPQAEPHHVAQTLLAVHQQPKTAWTSELDLRPASERFWEHC